MNKNRAYALLGVHKGSSPEQIKRMYYKKALKCHPDKNGNKEEFQELNEAYAFISEQDPIIPCLFNSSIHYVISMLDSSILLSLYTILMEYKEVVPEPVFDSIRKRLSIVIIEPSLSDLIEQRIYIYTHNCKKYSIPLWHHELFYDDFTVVCNPKTNLEMDDDNNIYVDVHSTIQNVFLNGLYIDAISHQVDISKLSMVPYQLYITPSTIPKVDEHNIYSAADCALFIVRIYLT
jgi:hypothetical protein